MYRVVQLGSFSERALIEFDLRDPLAEVIYRFSFVLTFAAAVTFYLLRTNYRFGYHFVILCSEQ